MPTASHSIHPAVIICAIILAVVILLSILLCSFAVEFLLNPNYPVTMQRFLGRIGLDNTQRPEGTVLSEETLAWREYRQQAYAWFDESGEHVSLTSRDGLTLSASRFAGTDPHRWVIACHGYCSEPRAMAGYIRKFHDMGCSVLAPAARGHGESAAPYVGMGWPDRQDLLDWADTIIAEDPRAEIILFGVSMGGATVLMAAGEPLPPQIKLVIEDCGYTSAWDEFFSYVPGVLRPAASLLFPLMDRFCANRTGYSLKEASALAQVPSISIPVLFIHGDADPVVPFEMRDQLWEACGSSEKERLTVPGAGHCSASDVDPALYWGTISRFMDREPLPAG